MRSLREFSGLDHVTNTARQKFEYILIDIDCQEEFVKTFSDGTIWKYKKASSLATIIIVYSTRAGHKFVRARKECE